MQVPALQTLIGPIVGVLARRSACPVCGRTTGPGDFVLHSERYHYECAAFPMPREDR